MLVPSLSADDIPQIDFCNDIWGRGLRNLLVIHDGGYWLCTDLKEWVDTLLNMMHLSVHLWFSLWSSLKALWEMKKMPFSIWIQMYVKCAWWVRLQWRAGGTGFLITHPCRWRGCSVRTICDTHHHNGINMSYSCCLRSITMPSIIQGFIPKFKVSS